MRLALLMLMIAAGLAAAAAYWRRPDAADEAAIVAPVRSAPADKGPAAPAPPPTGPALFRPLASQSVAPAPSDEALQLIGVVARGDARIALLRQGANGEAWRARSGDQVGGWTVVQIGAHCAILRRGADQRRVCL